MNWVSYQDYGRPSNRKNREKWIRYKLEKQSKEVSEDAVNDQRTNFSPEDSLFLQRLIHVDKSTGGSSWKTFENLRSESADMSTPTVQADKHSFSTWRVSASNTSPPTSTETSPQTSSTKSINSNPSSSRTSDPVHEQSEVSSTIRFENEYSSDEEATFLSESNVTSQSRVKNCLSVSPRPARTKSTDSPQWETIDDEEPLASAQTTEFNPTTNSDVSIVQHDHNYGLSETSLESSVSRINHSRNNLIVESSPGNLLFPMSASTESDDTLIYSDKPYSLPGKYRVEFKENGKRTIWIDHKDEEKRAKTDDSDESDLVVVDDGEVNGEVNGDSDDLKPCFNRPGTPYSFQQYCEDC